MSAILSATLPLFAIIALGYGLVRGGLIPKEGTRALGAFVLTVALPALIFTALSKRSFGEVLQPTYLIAFGIGTGLTALSVFVIARRLLGRDVTRAAIMALGAAGANSGFVGYPIAAAVVGPTAVMALAMCMLIENLLTIPLLLAVAEAGQGERRSAGKVIADSLRALARNPMILAIVAGLAASVTGLALPAALDRSVQMLAAASAPVALISIGGALAGLKLGREVRGIALVVFGKLVLHPLFVLAALALLPPLAGDLRRALLLIAAAPMMTIYPLIGARFGQGQLTAAAMLAATVLSFFTLSALVALT